MDDDTATILMCDSNLQREHILPSERAFAYKMKLEAVKSQAGRAKNNSPQVAANFRSDDFVAKSADISGDALRRFIRLTELVSEIMQGTLIQECGRMLVQGGYIIRVLNTIDFAKSMHYNPFAYIHSETDVLKLVTVIMENTKDADARTGEEFWTKAEALLYQALIGYIAFEAPEEERNMLTLLQLINASEAREDDEDFRSPVDMLFDQLEKENPDHFAVRQYKKFKLAAGDICSK